MSNAHRIFRLPGNVGDDVALDLQGRKIKGLEDGELVTIKRFGELHEGRTTGIGVLPGVWANYSWVTVQDARGNEHEISKYDLKPSPGSDYVLVPREFLRELPETPLWEDDVVEVYDGRRGYVSTIDHLEAERDPASEVPIYTVKFAVGSEKFHLRSLDLVERGDVWKFYNGHELHFESAANEANFYHRISHVTSVRNDDDSIWTFPWQQAVEALESGKADMIWHDWSVPLNDPGYNVSCYTIDDPEVGERCRLELLEQLESNTAPRY